MPGNCYFHCNYYDKKLVFPFIQTLRFLEASQDENGQTRWLFEEPIEPEELSDESSILMSFSEEQLSNVLELSDLQSKLQELSHFHPLTARQPTPPRLESQEQFVAQFGVLEQLEKTLASGTDESLGIMVRYTDDACFLKKTDGNFVLEFFPHPLRQPEIENALFALFDARGLAPTVNYLADDGRTRILDFPLPSSIEELVGIISEVFISVFAISYGDELVFRRAAI